VIKTMMEKIIHQIWVGPYEMPDREKGFVEKMKQMNPDWEHILWTDKNLPELPDAVRIRCDMFLTQKDYAHVADVLRVFLINKFGGIYLDVDFKPVGPLSQSDIASHEGVFFYHGGDDYTMPNGCFGSSKNSGISEYLLSLISPDFGGWYGPSWMGEMVKNYIEVPYETNHEIVNEKLKEKNIKYMLFSELETKYCTHGSLYSWSPENKRNFEEGNINYLK
jgi:mannosyltransferase OCH1-like enzyme